jgi:hypothetical protein
MEEKIDMTPQKPIAVSLYSLNPRGMVLTVKLGDEIGEMQHLNHREMARVLLE